MPEEIQSFFNIQHNSIFVHKHEKKLIGKKRSKTENDFNQSKNEIGKKGIFIFLILNKY